MTTAIGIVGCAGRMGRMVIEQVLATSSCQLAGGTEADDAFIGKDLGVLVGAEPAGLVVGDEPSELFEKADAVIDFTTPNATCVHAQAAAISGTAYVVGTTGLSKNDQLLIDAAAIKAPIVQAPNFSVGVNLLFSLTRRLAAALGPDYDIEILEMHHRQKIDAPSGTALSLGEAAAKGRGVSIEEVARYSREGTLGERPEGEIGFATLRGGGVVGDHTALFANQVERLELTHRAESRSIFAGGAVRAAIWLQNRPAGLYGMVDVLGLD